MATPDDLALLDATAQAELVRKKEVQPIELVEAAIDRIERLNPTLNAVITPMYELARMAAAEKLPEGPFTGVPFLLKDILASFAGGRLRRLQRVWFPWPMATTAAGLYAFRLPAAVYSDLNPPGPAIPWGQILVIL